MKERKIQHARTVVQLGALAFLVILLQQGRVQIFFLLFAGAGIIGSLFFGRVYCGWLCPMGTLLRGQTWVFKTFRIRRKSISPLPFLRWLVLAGTVALVIVTNRSGQQMLLMPMMILASLLVSLFVHEAFWHRSVCPFGALLSLAGKKSMRSIQISEASCIGCGACQRVCPAGSIGEKEEKIRYNSSKECLVCRACIPACPTKAITYES
mgnify:CR=1 FL=1